MPRAVPLAQRLAPVLLSLTLPLWMAACASTTSSGGTTSGTTGTSTTCPKLLAAVCSVGEAPGTFGISCASTWTLALADTHYCGGAITELQADCGAYLARIVVNVDVADTYYYDKASGALVAVFGTGYDGNTTCEGGPPIFPAPTCATPQPFDPCPKDGGAG